MSSWLSGYAYRKKITISGSTGAGTGYQVKLLLGESSGASGEDFDLENHCLNFPNDLRFTNNDGTTLLDHWLEDTSGTTPNRLITLWIEITDSLESDVDIYCYYGKAGDSSASNGTNTFEFFDDFDTGTVPDPTKWTKLTGSPSISGGVLTLTSSLIRSLTTYSYNTAVRSRTDPISWSENRGLLIPGYANGVFGESGTEGAYSYFWALLTSITCRAKTGGSQTTVVAAVSGSADFAIREEIRNGTTQVIYSEPGATPSSYTIATNIPTGLIEVQLGTENGSSEQVDWVLVRKYASPEPSFYSVGNEEIIMSHSWGCIIL